MNQRQFFGYTFWSLKTAIDGLDQKLAVIHQQRDTLQQQQSAERKTLEELEEAHNNNGQYRQIQDQLKVLQDQKNKLLEDLSLVRGKMQGQKTASGDPKTLLLELHQKEISIAETGEKLAASQKREQELGLQMQEQNRHLAQITEQLNRLYTHSKNPGQIDWALFDIELQSLDESFGKFYEGLNSAQDINSIKSQVEPFKASFGKFKETVKGIAKDPQASQAAFQQELQQILTQKEDLTQLVRKLDSEHSGAKIGGEFFAKQLSQLAQEKLHLELELKKAQSHSFDDFVKDLIAEEDRVKADLDAQSKNIAAVEEQLKAHFEQEEGRRRQIHEAENEFRNKQDQLSKVKDQEGLLNVEKAKYDTQMQVLTEEVYRILGPDGLKELAVQQVTATEPDLEEKIMRLKNQLDMIGGMDELTLKEYQETESRFGNLTTQVGDLKKSMADLRNIMDELDEHIKTRFNESFHKINEKFEFYFRLLFNGGRAFLSVLKAEQKEADVGEGLKPSPTGDNEDREDENSLQDLRPEEKVIQKYSQPASNIVGVDIRATPPGKKLSSIQALSGGERALTSIALLCSLLSCFPSPFVVLDEVDAALDESNTIRFGQILGTLAHQTQFITITHNRETMSQSTMLYGVTMGDDGISKLLSIKIDQATQYAK